MQEKVARAEGAFCLRSDPYAVRSLARLIIPSHVATDGQTSRCGDLQLR